MTADQTYFVENVLTNEVFYAQWLGQQTRLNSKAYQKSDIENIIDYKKDENGNYWILVEGKRSPEKRLDTHFRVKFVKSMGNARPNNPKAKSHQGELPFTISEMKDVQEGCLQNETFLQQTLSSNKIQQHLKNIRYYYEGGLQEHTLLKQSRNRTVRDQCIINSGGVCYVCGFDFSKTYGEMGKGFLEVHWKNTCSRSPLVFLKV